jgi:hypothetical protein
MLDLGLDVEATLNVLDGLELFLGGLLAAIRLEQAQQTEPPGARRALLQLVPPVAPDEP